MTNVDYKALKSCIIKSCHPRFKHDLAFNIDMDKLEREATAMNLIPIRVGACSKKITPETIAFIGEYYEKERLEWFNEGKEYTVISFIDEEDIDERAQELLDKIATPQVDDPDDDKVHDMALLLADYHCYNALVISYRYKIEDANPEDKHPHPKYIPSYSIMIRANKVVIKDSNYQYNPGDFS